jgi:glucose/mannose-6-phosphate isomerase
LQNRALSSPTLMLLDDAKALRVIDRSDMLSIMERAPARLAPPADAGSTCPERSGTVENVVFGGLGGSGIVGDILSDYCRESINIPVSVCRTLRIPKYVGTRTLFIAISYSGETQETYNQISQARTQGAEILVIASGGRILRVAEENRMPYLRVPSGLLPRVALPELSGAAVFALGSAKILGNTSRLLSQAAISLGDMIERVKQTVSSESNSAKQMAQALLGKLPLLIGEEAYGSVIRRFKNELNENSKLPAICYALPEGYHNDIEGTNSLRQLSNSQPILLRTRDESEAQNRTREQFVRMLIDLGFPPVIEFAGQGKDKLSEMLTASTFAGYVSVYLGALRGIDPAELTYIAKFREVMRGKQIQT